VCNIKYVLTAADFERNVQSGGGNVFNALLLYGLAFCEFCTWCWNCGHGDEASRPTSYTTSPFLTNKM
jgi:hypothetical protein